MDGARTIYDDGAVVVKGDTIVAVGPRSELEAKYSRFPDDRCQGQAGSARIHQWPHPRAHDPVSRTAR